MAASEHNTRRSVAEFESLPPHVKPEEHVTRFEVIDHTGRILVVYGVSVTLMYQDDCRTLKVFLTKDETNET